MTGRRFFYVFRLNGRETPALFHDERPTASALDPCGTVVYRQELFGDDRTLTVPALFERFRMTRELGTLPPDNMIPPPAPKRSERPSYDFVRRPGRPAWPAVDEIEASCRNAGHPSPVEAARLREAKR